MWLPDRATTSKFLVAQMAKKVARKLLSQFAYVFKKEQYRDPINNKHIV